MTSEANHPDPAAEPPRPSSLGSRGRPGGSGEESPRSTPRAASRPRGRWIVLAAFAILALGVLAAFQILSARRDLLAGSGDLRAASSMIHPASQLRDAAVRAQLRATLVRAENEFSAARSDLRLWSPLLDRLGWIPRVGGQLAAASPASDTAFYTTSAGLHLMDGLSPVWSIVSDPASSQMRLTRLASVLETGNGQFRAASSDTERAASAVNQLPSRTGNASLDRAAKDLRSALPALRAGTAWLNVAPAVLGMGRQSSYLFLLQNPAELRATGGFIGAAGWVTFQHGAMQTTFGNSGFPHEIDSVSTPLPEALYTAEGPWIFRDSNWSPDFPLSARLARWFYGEDNGRWAKGVIAVVDTAFAPFLRVTGPVYLPAYHRWVNEADVATVARQYRGVALTSVVPGADPKQFLGHVVTALLQRIPSLPIERWPALGTALSDAIGRREIMLYDRRPQVQPAILDSGADGHFLPAPGDYLAVVDDNRSYNKINPYVREAASYRVAIRPDLWLDATLAIRYHVAPSPADLHGAGPAFGLQGTKHDYEDFLRVYVPAGAQLVQMSGLDRWAPAPAYGLTQFAGRLLVREGQTRTVTLRYRIPANALSQAPSGRYVLTVRHQPGGNLTSLQTSIVGRNGVILSAPQGVAPDVTRILHLDRDARMDLSLQGTQRPRVVQLPRSAGPVDPYIPFSDFHDPRHPL